MGMLLFKLLGRGAAARAIPCTHASTGTLPNAQDAGAALLRGGCACAVPERLDG